MVVPAEKTVGGLVVHDTYESGPDVTGSFFGLTTFSLTDLRKWY